MTGSQAPVAARFDGTHAHDEVAAWVRLVTAPGIGPVAARLLLEAFGLPQQVFAQSLEALSSVVTKKLARAVLAAPGAALSGLVARTTAWLDEPGNYMVTLADDAYPARLFDLADPPPLLYIKGDPAVLARPALAIVGARDATAQGRRDAEAFGASFSEAGNAVVSGLALGVDGAAQPGGLRGCGGALGLADHGAPGGGTRARGICHSRIHPRTPVQRLPFADPAGRQAGGIGAGRPGRVRDAHGIACPPDAGSGASAFAAGGNG
nr:DNA-processing protein DprA [Cupriavidus sp. IDO]